MGVHETRRTETADREIRESECETLNQLTRCLKKRNLRKFF